MMDDYVDVYRAICNLPSMLGKEPDEDRRCGDCRFLDDDDEPECLINGRNVSYGWKCGNFERR